MTSAFFHGDIALFGEKKFDILFGNPPWCTFVDLPQDYKAAVKPLFPTYGLADNTQKLVPGGSRIDIVARIIPKSIADNVTENGTAVFFLPLSLFLNDGARTAFQRFISNGACYKPCSLYDFEGIAVFKLLRHAMASRYVKKLNRSGKRRSASPISVLKTTHRPKRKAAS
jgi:hypothetical protein